MAAARAPAELLQRRVSELSTCPICMDELQNAKVLPCLHTFCLECLKGLWKDKTPKQHVTCPVCRQQLSIPPRGLDALQDNFFVKSLMEVGSVSGGSSEGSSCDEHPDKRLERYCVECQVMICRKCQGTKHRRHDCQEVGTVAERFAKSLEAATGAVQLRIEEFHEVLEQQQTEDWQTQVAVKAADVSAKQHGEKIKTVVDGQVGELLQELREIKVGEQKDAKGRKAALQMAISELTSFSALSLELRTKGSPCDVVCRANDLCARASQLLETYLIPGDRVAPAVTFVPMNIDELTRDGQNLVGRLRRPSDSGGLNDTAQEVHLQTGREHQVEQHLIRIVRRLHSRTVQAMQEECRQARETQEYREKIAETDRERREHALHAAEVANQRLEKMKQQRQEEKAVLIEHLAAYLRMLHNELGTNVFDGRCDAMKMQDAASGRIKTLKYASGLALKRLECTKKEQKNWTWVGKVDVDKVDVPESEIRMAMEREKQIKKAIDVINARKEKWELDLSLSVGRTLNLNEDTEQSSSRIIHLSILLRQSLPTIVAQAKEMFDDADRAVQNEQVSAAKREKVYEEELSKASERINKLQNEISQVDERKHWLEELKLLTCSEHSGSRQLFRQTSDESLILKERLEQVLKDEQELLERLQGTQEREQLSIKALEKACGSLKSTEDKMTKMQRRCPQFDEILHLAKREKVLHERLRKAREREQNYRKETENLISKEHLLLVDLQLISCRENVFHIPITQLKYKESAAREIRVLSADDGAQVRGVTSLDDELFILRTRRVAEAEVGVYSKSDFTFLRRFVVRELSEHGVEDFVSCAEHNCLYIADSGNECIHKLTRDDDRWPKAEFLCKNPRGLSVASARHVRLLVACCDGKVLEMNERGRFVRALQLQSWVTELRHAVELSFGRYVVSYRSFWCGQSETIGVMDDQGKVTQSYGGWWICLGREPLRGPCQMAVDSDGFVFVADNDNNRLVLLNPSLQFVRFISTKKRPRWLHLDQESRRLFVGHQSNAVSVFQL